MSKRAFSYPQPVLLPPAGVWTEPEDVAAYARACLNVCGLGDWQVEWDRAVRRLGCCKMSRRVISISRHFAQYALGRDSELIRRTVLHELAHALAWVHYRERGHGDAWRYWCAALGIPGEKSACKCEDFTPAHLRKQPKYALCHRDTGEIYRYYNRMPSTSPQKLARCYIPGKKAATLGKLCIISLEFEPKKA